MRILVQTFALLLVMVIVGCATLPLESNLQKPVSMTKMTDDSVKDFVIQKQAFWLFWGAVPLVLPAIDEVVGSEVADHAGVQNLKITTEHTIIDLLIDALSGGFVYSQTITIQGKVYD